MLDASNDNSVFMRFHFFRSARFVFPITYHIRVKLEYNLGQTMSSCLLFQLSKQTFRIFGWAKSIVAKVQSSIINVMLSIHASINDDKWIIFDRNLSFFTLMRQDNIHIELFKTFSFQMYIVNKKNSSVHND